VAMSQRFERRNAFQPTAGIRPGQDGSLEVAWSLPSSSSKRISQVICRSISASLLSMRRAGVLDTRFRADLDSLAEPDEIEVIRGLPELFVSMAEANEGGGTAVLRYLADLASNGIRVGGPLRLDAPSAAEAIESCLTRFVVGCSR
jgi:hypothetical protein